MSGKPYPRVQITWRDAESIAGWQEAHEVSAKIEPSFTVGFLIREEDGVYITAGTIGAEGAVCDVGRIPKDWATKIEYI